MKRLTTLALIIVNLMTFIGCKSLPGKPNEPTPAKTATVGYSLPWSWNKADPVALAKALKSAGCTYTLIELDLWNTDPQFVANWVKPFRERGITVEIIAINGNSTELFKNSDAWFYAIVDGLIAKVGYDHIIFQPVCEPGNRGGDKAKCQRWMKYGYDHWKGQTAVPDHFSWADPFRSGRTYVEKHHCSDPVEGNLIAGINTSDCGPTLGMNPDRAYKSTKAAIKKNVIFILYDAQRDHSGNIDYAKIDAIKKAIQE